MSVTWDIELRIRRNGIDIVGSPYVRRISLTEGTDFDLEVPASQTSQAAVPGCPLLEATGILLNPQNTLSVLINSGEAITLNPGSLLLILDTDISGAAAADVISAANSEGVPVEVLGFESGN